MQALLTMSSVAWLETLACDGNQNAEDPGFVVRTNNIRKGYNLTMEVGKNQTIYSLLSKFQLASQVVISF